LAVEDNLQVTDVTAQTLGAMTFQVEVTDRSRKARDQLNSRGEHIYLLMTDVLIPERMNEPDPATQVKTRFPTLPIILTSGYNDVVASDSTAFPMLRKPLPYDELFHAVRANPEGSLDRGRPRRAGAA
jgi:DNA-binding NtrC family response regulator